MACHHGTDTADADKETTAVMPILLRQKRRSLVKLTVPPALVVLILGAAIESQPADSASAAVGTEVARTSDSNARQIVSDYESRQGNPNERSLIKGTAGLDVITVVYNAHNSITGKAGEYVLVASVRKGPNGQPDPSRLVAEKVDIYSGTGTHVQGGFPIYTYIAIPTEDQGQHAWTVETTIRDRTTTYVYNYTTGTPVTGHSLKLSSVVLQSLSSQALTILDAAPHHADIRLPAFPFPAPFVGTYARSPSSHTAAVPNIYLNVPMAHPERPASLPDYELNQPDTHDPSKFLSVQSHVNDITWSSWGGSTATGTGRVEVSSSDTRPGHEQPYASQSAAVSIVTNDLVSCGGRRLYTAYTLTLTGADPEPRDFAYVKDRSLPCRMQALTYYAGIEKVANTTGDCLFRGVTEQLPSGFGYLGYCRMEWKGWGKSSTVGIGIARAVMLPRSCDGHEECDYGIQVQLDQPEWCPTYGMSYTREKLEVFGGGVPLNSEPQTRTGVIAPSVERRLRTTIGHGRPRVFYDHARSSQHCETT